jgi:transposase
MTGKRIYMSKQSEILRLKGLGHSKSEVTRLLGVDRDTVRRYWEGQPLAAEVTRDPPSWVDQIDWDYIRKELEDRAPKKILYEEQGQAIELPSYQAFCEYLRKHKVKKNSEVTIKIHRLPGSSIEVDYSGDKVQILNPATGEIYESELFVGSLSFSGYFYAEFTMSQRLEDFIAAHNNMFSFFGGAASFIIPDNCKTAVIKNKRNEWQINSTYQDMCVHYGIVVDPADPYSPRHKPNVENAVGLIQKEFFPLIRHKTFTSLIELNYFFREWLLKKLQVEIRGRGQSRAFFFEQEKTFLKSLPDQTYELFYFKRAKVHPDCHFIHEKNYYSVPHQYVSKELDIKFNGKEIHAFYETNRIASHPIMKGSHHYSTNTAHYPEKKYVDMNYHVLLARQEGLKIGPNTSLLIERLLNEDRFPLKNLRRVQGVLQLTKQFEKEAMEYGSEMALQFEQLSYDRIRRFAKGYRPQKEKHFDISPARQTELICLQGGLH